MLTAIPPRVLHWLRDRARAVVALAELGLALTCPCGGDHGDGPALLGHDETPGEPLADVYLADGRPDPLGPYPVSVRAAMQQLMDTHHERAELAQ